MWLMERDVTIHDCIYIRNMYLSIFPKKNHSCRLLWDNASHQAGTETSSLCSLLKKEANNTHSPQAIPAIEIS